MVKLQRLMQFAGLAPSFNRAWSSTKMAITSYDPFPQVTVSAALVSDDSVRPPREKGKCIERKRKIEQRKLLGEISAIHAITRTGVTCSSLRRPAVGGLEGAVPRGGKGEGSNLLGAPRNPNHVNIGLGFLVP